jgi:hypothetical protein
MGGMRNAMVANGTRFGLDEHLTSLGDFEYKMVGKNSEGDGSEGVASGAIGAPIPGETLYSPRPLKIRQ